MASWSTQSAAELELQRAQLREQAQRATGFWSGESKLVIESAPGGFTVVQKGDYSFSKAPGARLEFYERQKRGEFRELEQVYRAALASEGLEIKAAPPIGCGLPVDPQFQ